MDLELPEIVTCFPGGENHPANQHYLETARRSLRTIARLNNSSYEKLLQESIPFFGYRPLEKAPGNLSFYVIMKYRTNAFKFYFDMISKWLVPGHQVDVTLFYAVDFRMPSVDDEQYTLAEVMLNVLTDFENTEIMRNILTLESEIKLGVLSAYYSRRILETKGLSSDEKAGNVQERILYVTKRLPNVFDQELFQEMQHVMILCSDAFKAKRDSLYLTKLISYSYFFRKKIREDFRTNHNKRHLFLKLLNRKLGENGNRVLGVLVAMSFHSDKEVFEARHLMKAIQNYLPTALLVEGSIFSARHSMDHLGTLYLEVEEEKGGFFDYEDICRLREELPTDLKDRVEHMMHPIFMPRNEEEIMRNVLSLGDQIKYTTDLPQMFVSFDEQTYQHLYFTIILVQVIRDGSERLDEKFAKTDTFLDYMHDFTKVLGTIRKKYKKEASVFRIKLRKETFLRDDHSIDLYKARNIVVTELERILGRFRDYNGGMISKQNEQLCRVRTLLSAEGVYNDLLLENFFYSLTPATLRSLLDPYYLKTLFLLLLDTLEAGTRGEPFAIEVRRDLHAVYVIIISENRMIKKEIGEALAKMNIPRGELGSVAVNASGCTCLGYILRSEDPYSQDHFCSTIQSLFPTRSKTP